MSFVYKINQMPPQFGTEIVDWKGVLHDVTKQAFDAAAVRDKIKGTRDFGKTLEQYVKKVGLEVDFSEPGAMANLVREAASTIASAYAGKVLTAAAAMATGVELGAAGGPVGIVIGIAAEFAIQAFFTEDESFNDYKPGQWVMLDNGSITVSKQVKREVSFGEVEMFGDMPWQEDFELDSQEDFSIGFIMGPNSEAGFWMAFNFKTSDVQRYHRKNIRPASSEVAEKLDGNDELTIVREFKFLKEDGAYLNSSVPTKPGSEVFYDEKPYTVVSSVGPAVVIQNDEGSRSVVDISKLQRGKVTQTVSFNHRAEGETISTPGFVTTPQGVIFQGQWVWLPASITQRLKYDDIPRSLALVLEIDRTRVKGVYAIDGDHFNVDERDCMGVDEKTTYFVSQLSTFQKFKSRALQGKGAIDNHWPGVTFRLLCMGIGRSPGEALFKKVTNTWQDKMHGEYHRLRQAERQIKISSVTTGEETRRADYEEELVQKGVVSRHSEPLHSPPPEGNVAVLVAALAIGLFVFANN